MIIKKYMLTTLRLMSAKWWLSLIKLFSLTTGILSFLLVWFFYLDYNFVINGKDKILLACSAENLLLLGFILISTTVIYFLLMKSQIAFRHKELFFRKYYGESSKGIIGILMIETSIYTIIAFVLSLVLLDQVAPLFNIITDRSIDLQQIRGPVNLLIVFGFLSFLGLMVGVLPSIWYSRYRAIDILRKLAD